MKTSRRQSKAKLAASSLVLVLVVCAAGIVLVGGVMNWISTKTDLTLRVNQFRATTAAGGAATEKVVGEILGDFRTGGITAVSNNLPFYPAIVPTDQDLLGTAVTGILDPITGLLQPSPEPAPEPTTEWAGFEFSDGSGNVSKSDVDVVSPWTYGPLSSSFAGLNGYSVTYRLLSSVRDTTHRHKTVAGVQQNLVLASIPVFAFHVFYAADLEICPSTPLTLGRVHANGSVYCQPSATLTLAGPVTTARRIIHDKHPFDSTVRSPGQIVSVAERETGVNTLLPPLGTNRSLAAFRGIIEVPPATESRTSTPGSQRLYNKADLIISVTSTGFVARSGAYDSFATVIPWSELGEIASITGGTGKGGKVRSGSGKKPKKSWTAQDGVVSTNVSFRNLREGKTVRCTEIDISQLIVKSNYLFSKLNRPVKTLYVSDTRTSTNSTLFQSGVRIIFGQTLPPEGLTIVTPNPLYVLGDYNVPATLAGTTNTSGSVPAALIADAITILSDDWTDTESGFDLSYRVATNTTVNAALLAGIVPTRPAAYSGGLENFPRLLEDWNGMTLTINGSFVALFDSQIAKGPWGGLDVYVPPVRKFSYNTRLNTLAGKPPSTPELHTAFRRSWQSVVAQH